MNANQALRIGLETSAMLLRRFLEDLEAAELFQRPAPKCNHINWQLGHLILSEHTMIAGCFPGGMPTLPEGFSDQYSRASCHLDDPVHFLTKEELVHQFDLQRNATLQLLDHATAEKLAHRAPESIRSYAPTTAAAFAMQDIHTMMHVGQWTVIRRQLGREPLI